ncbi:MAG: response regulator [Lachnospiraceae bacterium]|nr:response regulator [Lachnospiraceae bacterium]
MKKIFFIGKINALYKDISNYLSQNFKVQMCVDDHEMVRGMLKVEQPDLVIISLVGLDVDSGKIFSELKFNYSRVPVICIGTEGEVESFNEFFKLEQFSLLIRPLKNEKILEEICTKLELEYSEEGVGATPEEKGRKKVILLVDDNAMQLRTLNEMLKQTYDVQMATSGMKALTLIGKKKPDIIFLDYEMPMCDGKMTLEMIREVEEAKDIPVVFLTGVNDKEHIEAVLRLKPAGYLLKPASAEMIFNTLDKFLG